MKYAFYPGCVARGGTPELLSSSMAVLKELDIEIEELTKAGFYKYLEKTLNSIHRRLSK